MPVTQVSATWLPPGPLEGEPELCLCPGSWCCSSCLLLAGFWTSHSSLHLHLPMAFSSGCLSLCVQISLLLQGYQSLD